MTSLLRLFGRLFSAPAPSPQDSHDKQVVLALVQGLEQDVEMMERRVGLLRDEASVIRRETGRQ